MNSQCVPFLFRYAFCLKTEKEVRTLKIEDLHFDFPSEPVDEENWDLDTWRKEHPMDYFKSLYILGMADIGDAQAKAFKAIYQIARLHVPDVLYKYYSLSNDETLNLKKFQTLNDGKIFMSDIKDFNDPFDGKGFFYDATKLADINRLKPHDGRMIDDFNRFIKGACLTANGVQSMPMWAHYGSNHKGFCVSYDMDSNIALKGNTFPVQYTDERLDISSLMRKQALYACTEIERQGNLGKKEIVLDDLMLFFAALLLCNVKHASWNYEKEFRCTTSAITPGMPFIDAKPKKIYIGMHCDPNHAKRLKEIGYSWGIPVYKMVFKECSETFCLTAEKY